MKSLYLIPKPKRTSIILHILQPFWKESMIMTDLQIHGFMQCLWKANNNYKIKPYMHKVATVLSFKINMWLTVCELLSGFHAKKVSLLILRKREILKINLIS